MCTMPQFILLRGAMGVCMATGFLVRPFPALGVKIFWLDPLVRQQETSIYAKKFRGNGLYLQPYIARKRDLTVTVRGGHRCGGSIGHT